MTERERVPLNRDFTTMEKLVVALVARGDNYPTIGTRLHISPKTAKYHAANAARKIPGDLPVITKILFWSRGATIDQLRGDGWVPKSPSKTIMAAADGEEYPIY